MPLAGSRMALKWNGPSRRGLFAAVLAVALATVAVAVAFFPPAPVLAESQQCGDPNYFSMTYSFEGYDKLEVAKEGAAREYTGTWSGKRAHISGRARITVGQGYVTTGSISATIGGDKETKWVWPGPTEISGRTVEESFDLSYDIPAGYTGPVYMNAWVGVINGISEGCGVSVWLLPGASTAASPTPEGTVPPPPEEDDGGGTPWGIIIGSLAAGAAVIAAVAATMRARKAKAGFVLQVSTNRLVLQPGQPGTLHVAVHRVLPAGGTAPAPGVPISLASAPGLVIQPAGGAGAISVQVSGAAPGDYALTASAGAASATITVSIQPPLVLRALVNGATEGEVIYDPERKEWLFPDVIVFFDAGDGLPAHPAFRYGFPTPAAVAAPPVVEVAEFSGHPDFADQYTMKLRAVAQLPESITITITAIDDHGMPYPAHVVLRPRQDLVWVIYGYDRDVRRASGHAYQAIDLKELEFACDAADELHIVAFAARVDQLEPGKEVLAVVELPSEPRFSLDGPDVAEFAFDPNPEDTGNGFYAFKVRSLRPLLFTQQEPALTFRAEAPNLRPGERALAPQYLYLRLWVLPALKPGFSEASAFVRLPRHPKGFLSGVKVQLGVDPVAGAALLEIEGPPEKPTGPRGFAWWRLGYSGLTWLNLQSCQFHVKAGLPDRAGAVREATEVLVDVGRNVSLALNALVDQRDDPNLRLGYPNLGRNLDREGALEYGAREGIDAAFPDFLSGPALNIGNMAAMILQYVPSGQETLSALLTTGGQVIPALPIAEALQLVDELGPYMGPWFQVEEFRKLEQATNPYMCGALSKRVYAWLVARRFAGASFQARALMNGIEANQWLIGLKPLSHHFSGIHLSGNSPETDFDPGYLQGFDSPSVVRSPRFIDPWWRQAWDLEEYRSPDGLITVFGERMRAEGLVAMASVLGVAAVTLLQVPVTLPLMVVLEALAQLVALGTGGVDSGEGNFNDDGNYVLPGLRGSKLAREVRALKGYDYDWETEAIAWLETELAEAPPVEPVRKW